MKSFPFIPLAYNFLLFKNTCTLKRKTHWTFLVTATHFFLSHLHSVKTIDPLCTRTCVRLWAYWGEWISKWFQGTLQFGNGKKETVKAHYFNAAWYVYWQRFAQCPGQRSPERNPGGQVGLISWRLEVEAIFQAEKAVSANVRRSERTQNTVELTGNR